MPWVMPRIERSHRRVEWSRRKPGTALSILSIIGWAIRRLKPSWRRSPIIGAPTSRQMMKRTKINRDLVKPDMHVLRVDQPARGKSLITATLIAPKMSRLPATFEEAVAEQNERLKRQVARNCLPTRPIRQIR